MAEVYPSDNELLNLINESETGVEYIPTGTAPYYLHFRKLLYRLLLATKRGNDLRVFDEGGLYFGVKAGKFYNGNTLVEYAGSSGNLLADDKANIFVYLDGSGILQFTEYSAWPDMSTEPHVRLAVITTSGGDITSIVDCRDHHNIAMPNNGRPEIEAHTGDGQLDHSESGSLHTNEGAGGTVTLTLPSTVVAGTKFTFFTAAAYEFRIDPGSNAILDSTGTTADKYKYNSTIGSSLTVVSDANGDWMVTNKSGVWQEEV